MVEFDNIEHSRAIALVAAGRLYFNRRFSMISP